VPAVLNSLYFIDFCASPGGSERQRPSAASRTHVEELVSLDGSINRHAVLHTSLARDGGDFA
jgi:hypothetical protein